MLYKRCWERYILWNLEMKASPGMQGMMMSIPSPSEPLLSSEALQCWLGDVCLKEEGLCCVPCHSWLKIAGKNHLVAAVSTLSEQPKRTDHLLPVQGGKGKVINSKPKPMPLFSWWQHWQCICAAHLEPVAAVSFHVLTGHLSSGAWIKECHTSTAAHSIWWLWCKWYRKPLLSIVSWCAGKVRSVEMGLWELCEC